MPLALNRRHCLLALAALAGLSHPALQAANVYSAAAVRLPPLPLRERRLANGLRVVGLPDNTTATVAVQVWYLVGSKDDPAGRSGFAHLFEHMMFKRTRYMKNEMFDRLTEDFGGYNNAFTADDVTVYQALVPSNHLEPILWAEAERMAHLQVDQANFDSERAVVIEEYRQRVLASPYGRLFNALPAQAFEVHPYKRPGIGNIDELNAATLDDVRQFHATFYRPDNAVLIVAGDFDPAQFDAWVDRYFGPLQQPAQPVPRVNVEEPLRTQARRVALTGPNVPLPAVALLWQGPKAASDDAPALQVASALLSAGESSRLNQALVYRERSAQSAGCSIDLFTDAGMITAYAILAQGQQSEKLEAALLQEITRLANGPIAEAELDKVRSQLLTSALASRQRPDGQCDAVGWALVHHGEARAADRELGRLQAVGAGDVQRVLRRYLLDAQRVTVTYTQAAA